MTDRRRDSVKARRICFEAHKWLNEAGQWRLTCHLNKCVIDPIRKNSWRADHIRRHAEDGEETAENLWPICMPCDVQVKAPHDTSEVAKGKRVRDSLYIKNKPKGRPMPGSRASGVKRKMDGTTVDRRTGLPIGRQRTY